MDIQKLIVSVLPILIAITFHEVSHGFVANKLGDPTAKFTGRLTLNPIAHIDPIGTVIIPIVLLISGAPVFGYAKPVPINPMNFKDPKRDMAVSAAAGPITNLALAFLSTVILKVIILPLAVVMPESIGNVIMLPLIFMFKQSIIINVVLAVFNLLPIPPLDGGRVLVGFLPHQQAVSFSRIEPYGFFIVIILLITGIAGLFIWPIVNLIFVLLNLL